jgi:AcrR family transcriptional regulator
MTARAAPVRSAPARRGPGRPRDAAYDGAILDAASDLLGSVGYEQLTVDAVAAAAGVGRPAVYRRWPSKASLALAAVARRTGPTPVPDTGEIRGDLLTLQRHQVRLMSSTAFRTVVPALIAHLGADDDPGADPSVREFIDLRRTAVRTVVERAIGRGELPADLDVDFVYDALTGPLFYRVVTRGERLAPALAERSVDLVLGAFATRRPRRAAAPRVAARRPH